MSYNQNNKFLLWDFDWTLATRIGGWKTVLFDILKEYDPETGIRPEDFNPLLRAGFPWHEADKFHGRLDSDTWWTRISPTFERAFTEVAGLNSNTSHDLALKVRKTYLNMNKWMLFEDVIPVLKELKMKNWTHIILTNHVPEVEQIIQGLGIHDFFDRVLNSADIGYENLIPKYTDLL